jgi:hypothetical protein
VKSETGVMQPRAKAESHPKVEEARKNPC